MVYFQLQLAQSHNIWTGLWQELAKAKFWFKFPSIEPSKSMLLILYMLNCYFRLIAILQHVLRIFLHSLLLWTGRRISTVWRCHLLVLLVTHSGVSEVSFLFLLFLLWLRLLLLLLGCKSWGEKSFSGLQGRSTFYHVTFLGGLLCPFR